MSTTFPRITAVDAFRGFALAGVVVVHMVEQYLATMPPEDLMAAARVTVGDQVVEALLFLFVRGKFFALFSFLFGLSFFLQMDRAAGKGEKFRWRFMWRLSLLLFIGYAHSLFYRGDILTIYAILGFFLVLFYKVRSSVCLGFAAAILLGAPRYLLFATNGADVIIPGGDINPELAHNQVYFDAILSGSLWDVFAANAWGGHLMKMEFQINYFGRWYMTFAFFLLGLLAGRMRLFARLDELHRQLKKGLWVSLAAFIVFLTAAGFLFQSISSAGNVPDFNTWSAMFALTFVDLSNLGMAGLLLTGFLLLFRRARWKSALSQLAPYGRMALSNYFLQTVIGTFVLYNFGLGLLGKLKNTDMLLIAVIVLAAQMAVSALWLRRFRYGPLEWLWRSGTWLRWQPMVLPGGRLNNPSPRGP